MYILFVSLYFVKYKSHKNNPTELMEFKSIHFIPCLCDKVLCKINREVRVDDSIRKKNRLMTLGGGGNWKVQLGVGGHTSPMHEPNLQALSKKEEEKPPITNLLHSQKIVNDTGVYNHT
jgi:hypothetical protein